MKIIPSRAQNPIQLKDFTIQNLIWAYFWKILTQILVTAQVLYENYLWKVKKCLRYLNLTNFEGGSNKF